MKKLKIILLKISEIIVVAIIALIVIFIYITKIKITDVAEFVNEKNKYKIIFQAVGEPEFPFGRTKVKVTLVNSNNIKVKSFKKYISDDGATASKSNIAVNWKENYVEVILKGSEQKDDIHILKYNFFSNLKNDIYILTYNFFSNLKDNVKNTKKNNNIASNNIDTNNEKIANIIYEDSNVKENDILYEKKFDENNIIRIIYKGAILGQKSIIEIKKSNDNGKTWINQLETSDGYMQVHNNSKFVFIDNNIGFINDSGLAGTNNEYSALLVTVDGGKNFVESNIINPEFIQEENLIIKDVPYMEDNLLKLKIYTINYNKNPRETYYQFYSQDNGLSWNCNENK